MPPFPRSRPTPRLRLLAGGLAVALLVGLAGCAADADPVPDDATSGQPSATAGEPQQVPTTTQGPVVQPPVPADPADYTPEYVQATLVSLFQDFRLALVALRSSRSVDETVRAAMATVYHPRVYDQQVRNLEDYYPDGQNIEESPGEVLVNVTGIHSATPDCILAVTTFSIDALTTLDAPAEENFFIGLARNPTEPDGTRPWLITNEYSTSDGEPLPEDVCA